MMLCFLTLRRDRAGPQALRLSSCLTAPGELEPRPEVSGKGKDKCKGKKKGKGNLKPNDKLQQAEEWLDGLSAAQLEEYASSRLGPDWRALVQAKQAKIDSEKYAIC